MAVTSLFFLGPWLAFRHSTRSMSAANYSPTRTSKDSNQSPRNTDWYTAMAGKTIVDLKAALYEKRKGKEATWPSPPHEAPTFSWRPFLLASLLLPSSSP